jgi:competence protein ComGC
METNPPVQPPPRTTPLAVWSLVLGILSLTCFALLSGIPAVICGHVARSRVKSSNGALQGNGLALAGLITGYLGIAYSLLVIPMLLAIAIPNFVKARSQSQRAACVMNLRAIEGATATWALEHKKTQNDTPTAADLFGPDKYMRETPVCPAGGTYTLRPPSEKPTCSIPEHAY